MGQIAARPHKEMNSFLRMELIKGIKSMPKEFSDIADINNC